MRTEIRRIQQEAGITAIYVTHDQSEAMAISDKIIIMEKGIVAQMGSPQEIYYHPKSKICRRLHRRGQFPQRTSEIKERKRRRGRYLRHEGRCQRNFEFRRRRYLHTGPET